MILEAHHAIAKILEHESDKKQSERAEPFDDESNDLDRLAPVYSGLQHTSP